MARREPRSERGAQQPREFDQSIIEISRVTRVVAGGKRMRFRACVVIGDHKGRVGYALAKGADVALAVSKAATAARKTLITIPITEGTIPHEAQSKYGAAMILLKPAPSGTGVIAGGPVRAVIQLTGITNIVTKMKGSRNKVNNVKATFDALKSLHSRSK